MPKKAKGEGGADEVRQALCDGCGEYCSIDARETHAVTIEDCMPLVLCGECCRRVVWGWLEREAS